MAATLWIDRASPNIAPDQIEGTLRTLWGQVEANLGGPLSRALTTNLIAVTPTADRDRLQAELERLQVRHRSRVFVVEWCDDVESLEVGVKVRARPCRYGGESMLEQITLRCSTSAQARIPSIVRARLAVDVPTHLYWSGPLADEGWLISALARTVDHIIVASGRFDDPTHDRNRLASWIGDDWCDLAEFRTRPWRRALAEAFEHFEWSAALPTAVRIEHAEASASKAAAIALARWIEQRLRAHVVASVVQSDAPRFGEPIRIVLDHGQTKVLLERLPERPRIEVTVHRSETMTADFTVLPSASATGDLLAAAIDSY